MTTNGEGQPSKDDKAKQRRDAQEAAHLTDSALTAIARTKFKDNGAMIRRLVNNVQAARSENTAIRKELDALRKSIDDAQGQASLLDYGPPCNSEAEQALLGALILDNRWIAKVRPELSDDDFFLDDHRAIYQAICRIDDASSPVDTLILFNEIKRAGLLEEIGGEWRLAMILQGCPSAANAPYYHKMVQRASAQRAMFNVAFDIIERLANDEDPIEIAKQTGLGKA